MYSSVLVKLSAVSAVLSIPDTVVSACASASTVTVSFIGSAMVKSFDCSFSSSRMLAKHSSMYDLRRARLWRLCSDVIINDALLFIFFFFLRALPELLLDEDTKDDAPDEDDDVEVDAE